MVESKYIMIVGVICLGAVIYYFYNEIVNSYKMVFSTYRKTMQLESKVAELEMKVDKFGQGQVVSKPKNTTQALESVPMTMTYNSDMKNLATHGHLSVAYSDLSDGEVNEMRKKIQNGKKDNRSRSSDTLSNSEIDIGDFNLMNSMDSPKANCDSETEHQMVIDLSPNLSPKQNKKRTPLQSPKQNPKRSPKRTPPQSLESSPKPSPKPSPKSSPKLSPKLSPKSSPSNTYQQILNELSTETIDVSSDTISNVFDLNVAKHISNSVNLADKRFHPTELSDLPSETETKTISEISDSIVLRQQGLPTKSQKKSSPKK